MPSLDIDTGVLRDVLGDTILSYLALMALWSSYAQEAVKAGEVDRAYDYARTAASMGRTAALCLHGRVDTAVQGTSTVLSTARTGTYGW